MFIYVEKKLQEPPSISYSNSPQAVIRAVAKGAARRNLRAALDSITAIMSPQRVILQTEARRLDSAGALCSLPLVTPSRWAAFAVGLLFSDNFFSFSFVFFLWSRFFPLLAVVAIQLFLFCVWGGKIFSAVNTFFGSV